MSLKLVILGPWVVVGFGVASIQFVQGRHKAVAEGRALAWTDVFASAIAVVVTVVGAVYFTLL